MPLAPGSRLGPYVLQSLLGPGGMGEVYRADILTIHDVGRDEETAYFAMEWVDGCTVREFCARAPYLE